MAKKKKQNTLHAVTPLATDYSAALKSKLPTWAAAGNIMGPHHLCLEQCSGELAARYKAQVVSQLLPQEQLKYMVDMTGGLGVDFSFIAPLFNHATYVERQMVLCQAACHNLPLLGLAEAEVVNADGVEFVSQMKNGAADLLFIDPARRDGAGRKTVLIEDCQPDVCALQSMLRSKARFVVIKLSPMLDITAALRSLQGVAQVHVVAVGGECKDLLLVLHGLAQAPLPTDEVSTTPIIYAHEGEERTFAFTQEQEAVATVTLATDLSGYLYEPGPAVMKAGAFKSIAAHYGLAKLHPNTHLYVAQHEVANFPGRVFRIVGTFNFSKAQLKQLRTDCPKANISVRNFPATVAEVRKKIKLKDGGDQFIFATTWADNQHVLIHCTK